MDPITLNELFFAAIDTFKQKSIFRYKKDGTWHGRTAAEVDVRVRELSLGLASLGIGPGDPVAIMSENRPEWTETDLAILTARAVTVPIYPNVPPEQAEYILADSGAKALFASNAELATKIRRSKTPKLAHVVTFDESGTGGTMKFADVIAKGMEKAAKEPYVHRAEAQKARPEDLATLIYTSGTTGNPKGVMLTHRNIASNVVSSTRVIPIGPDDLALSFLPLSHIFERMLSFAYIHRGAAIAYAESMDKVPQNIAEVKPTIVAAVPRFYEKTYEKITDAVRDAKPSRRRMFEWAVEIGRDRSQCILQGRPIPQALQWKYRIASMLVFRKIREKTGGRIRLFISGGAPLPRDIGEFFHACGFTVIEGYGLTETSPVITVNRVDDLKFGTVGKPVPDVDVRIAEDGEILVRGPNVMKGYHGMAKETKEVFTDGWFHTGDVGQFDTQGFLVITDRKKDLIKTSGGKYVAPQPLENALKASPWVAQAVVLGDRRKFCIALIVPRFDSLVKFAAEHGIAWETHRQLLDAPAVKKLFEDELEKVNKGHASFETLKKFALLEQEFSIAGGELTPTLKVKRKLVEERLKAVIDALFIEEPKNTPPTAAPA